MCKNDILLSIENNIRVSEFYEKIGYIRSTEVREIDFDGILDERYTKELR